MLKYVYISAVISIFALFGLWFVGMKMLVVLLAVCWNENVGGTPGIVGGTAGTVGGNYWHCRLLLLFSVVSGGKNRNHRQKDIWC